MKVCKSLLIAGALACAWTTQAATDSLVGFGSDWKYLDNGSDQGTAWFDPAFNDGAWASGPAELGYGDAPPPESRPEATVVSFGPNAAAKYVTTYFRHSFTVANPAIYLSINLGVVRDDGVVVYLNGVEIFRNGMPQGTISFTTPANFTSGGTDEFTPQTTTVNPALLRSGNNVIAAEIHQATPNSSDISFDLELVASTDPIVNPPPTVAIVSPGESAFFTAPANIAIAASASDTAGGSVALVEFFQGATKLGEDGSSPYNFAWNSVPIGGYALRAVATDNLGGRGTSSVVNVTVGVSTPPAISSKVPAPGNVGALKQIAVTFSEPVKGVDASDLVINGVAAAAVSGSGAAYTFTFPQPAEGTVRVAWNGTHGIQDFESPGRAFDPYGTGAQWQYTLTDTTAPTVLNIDPPAGATLTRLGKITVTFSEPVIGVNTTDLLINGATLPGVKVSGAVETFEFDFNSMTNNGTLNVAWAGGHGIRDQAAAGNAFAGGSWSYTINTNALYEGTVVINEIMYHPSSERIDEEYIELLNRGTTTVNLTGWRLTRGVNFTFPSATLAAGAYLVVAANTAAFHAKYPAVANHIGGWDGRLSNSYEDIEVEDAAGNRVDSVSYADEGDFAGRVNTGPATGLEWFSEADGPGSSLELRNPALSNNRGQNWAPSLAPNGTPGAANSTASANIPPMIVNATHFPAIPKSTEPVTITARIEDELTAGLTVRVWTRDVTGGSSGSFVSAAMVDTGGANDGAAGDGVFGVVLPMRGNGTIIEYYIEALDPASNARTWPGPVDGTQQTANAFYQVDDDVYTGNQPIYRMIMSVPDRGSLIDQQNRRQINVTFITIEGPDVEIRHNCGARRRGASSFGANPPTMKFNIATDRLWNGKSSINLNSIYTYAQVLGSALALKAGLPVANGRPVQVRFNAANLSQSGSQMFGSYAQLEVLNSEWAEDMFPNDGAGNVYSKRRPECGLLYQGSSPQGYINCAYDKESNASENDWTDLMNLTFALDPSRTPDNEYLRAVNQNLNIDLWLRYFAVNFLMNYNETALCTAADDDYNLYRGVVDPRFMVICHDFDSIFGTDGTSAEDIFVAAGMSTMSRFLHHPSIEPLFYEEYRRQLAGMFETNNLFPLFDQVMGGWVPSGTIQSMKTSALNRRNYVLGALPAAPTVIRATINGEPDSPSYLNTATLTVGGAGITHYRYRLNNGALSPETPVATPLALTSLADGTYTVYVIGRNSTGTYQAESDATISRTWAVLSGTRRVVINEVLARNVSAVNHSGTFPDIFELYNAGTTTATLTGMRLTDDPDNPNKYVFPATTTLASGAYLPLYANNPDGTPGIHVGFSLNQDGESLYLFASEANRGVLVDQVTFGLQLPDRSVGRLPGGQWGLTTPTIGAANTAAPTGNPASLRINEWLAIGQSPFLDDFIEVYNPNPLPVAIGGMSMTDRPFGDPRRHVINPLSFIPGSAYQVFTADGNSGDGHVGFELAGEGGEIGLFSADGALVDHVVYGLQKAGVSQGRSPNGSNRIASLPIPTPGVGNPAPADPIPPEIVNIIPLNSSWKFEDSNTDLGTTWRDTAFNDTAWLTGPTLIGYETDPTVEPIRTQRAQVNGRITTYYRARFNLPSNPNLSGVEIHHVIDDGAVFYVNGVEVGRFNLSGAVGFNTLASPSVGNATLQGPIAVPLGLLTPSGNVLAVEVHQSASTSSDQLFGLMLDAIIINVNPALAGLNINEVLANNQSLTNTSGTITDWVEIYNPANTAVDLSQLSLTDDLGMPQRWLFPAGSVIPPLGYFTVRFDPSSPPTTNSATPANTGFGLAASGSSLFLFNKLSAGGEPLDGLSFGIQAPDLSIGRTPDGAVDWVLTQPSPGGPNIPSSMGDPGQLRINEWMADPASGPDWFELVNPNAQPVSIGGLNLTDDLNNRLKNPIPALSFIAAGVQGFLKFVADEDLSQGADHVDFALETEGDSLGLATASGTLIDSVTFGAQLKGVSQGRLPDATATIVSFPTTASPAESNYLPISNVAINEILTHTDLPYEDAIELRNLTGAQINIGGWFLSDSRTLLKKFRIPTNTMIPANGFKVFYEYQFNPTPGAVLSFALSSAHGDQVIISQALLNETLTGNRAVAEFGPAHNGVPFGRVQTSVDVQYASTVSRTFGVNNPENVQDFRGGAGAANSALRIGPVVINEIMYHPRDIDVATDNVLEEFIELRNTSTLPVDLFDPNFPTNTCRVRGGVSFNFPQSVTMAGGAYLLLVSFNPVTDPASSNAFRAAYGLASGVRLFGPYEGKLDNSGDTIEFYEPDPPQLPGTPEEGFVPYVLVERVAYSQASPWPTGADGTGLSLQRLNAGAFANDPVNWNAAAPTPGPAAGPPDADSDGMPDAWENQYGLNPNNPNDANQDKDLDGLTNLEEYQSGTDPGNPASNLAAAIVAGTPPMIEFIAQPNIPYTVQYRLSLNPGTGWQTLSNVAPAASQRFMRIPATGTEAARFYQIRTP